MGSIRLIQPTTNNQQSIQKKKERKKNYTKKITKKSSLMENKRVGIAVNRARTQ